MKKSQTAIIASFLAAFISSGLLMLAGCGNESTEVPEGGEGEACYADGTCELGLLCNDAGLCEKEEEPDPCEDVDCGEHGLCEVLNDQASCTCEDGFHPEGLSCVQDIDPNTIGPLPVEETPLAEGTLFAAPDGSGETCTEALPCNLWTAADKSLAGDVVFLRGGIYDFNESLNIRHSGTAENPILFESYPQEEAILDGSQNELGSSVYLRLYGDYLIFRRMEIRNMPRQGLYIQGCHNVIDGV
ncbi:MAG: hypothetical protein JRF33_27480, partial [Deltaproteobacteria bacterium]|nr:hypothetical protein [Deltaproteobacteria bacterium]